MNVRRTLAAASAAALLVLVPANAFARHGGDDGPGHDRNDDRTTSARHGGDDGPGHHRHGGDDGPGHH